MFCFPDGECETSEDGGLVVGGERFEEGVPAELDGFQKDEPSLPGLRPLVFRVSCDSGLAGILASHTQR